MKISAVILTKNEEKNMSEYIKGLSFCEEIIVIDDFSSDEPLAKAKGLGGTVFQRALKGDFSEQRNFALTKAQNTWVFFIDADERVSPALTEEIRKEIGKKENSFLGYYLKRDDFFLGKKLRFGETANLKVLRLGRKSAGKWVRSVHEVWEIKGKVKTLKNPILHYAHASLKEFISEINFHSDLHAEANQREGKEANLGKIIFWPIGKFLDNWIVKRGFLDGTRGFMMALLMSFHSFLSWSKLWIRQQKR